MSEHKAGRELDALIAEKVMCTFIPAGSNPGLIDDAWISPSGYFVWEPPQYSTSIAEAWLVVEKFRRGWNGHVAACIDLSITDEILANDCRVTIYGPTIATVSAEAVTIPLAICLAALMAVEGKP